MEREKRLLENSDKRIGNGDRGIENGEKNAVANLGTTREIREMIANKRVPALRGFNCDNFKCEGNYSLIDNYVFENIDFFKTAFPNCYKAGKLEYYVFLATCEQVELLLAGKKSSHEMFFDFLARKDRVVGDAGPTRGPVFKIATASQ